MVSGTGVEVSRRAGREEVERTAVCGPVPHCIDVIAFADEGTGRYGREIEVFDFVLDGFVDGCCHYESDFLNGFQAHL
jgi:hypothetical protein